MEYLNQLILMSRDSATLKDIARVFKGELHKLSPAAQHKILLQVFGDGRVKREYDWEKEAYASLTQHEKSEALPPPPAPAIIGGGLDWRNAS